MIGAAESVSYSSSCACLDSGQPLSKPPAPINLFCGNSIDKQIAKKHLGTAINILEKQCESEPENFATWLKLAGYGVNCANLQLAEKVIRRIEANLAFASEQKQQARRRLQAWRHQ